METLENLLAGKVEELESAFLIYAMLDRSNEIYAVSGVIEQSRVVMMTHFPHLKAVKSKLTVKDIYRAEARNVSVIDAGCCDSKEQAVDRINFLNSPEIRH